MEYSEDEPGSRVRYARNEHYWRGLTKVDEIEFRFLDMDPAMSAYRNGEVDVIWADSALLPSLEADPTLSRELVTIPEAGTSYFPFKVNTEPFTDKRVREAFAYAFDRKSYCQEIEYGACTATLSLIPPGLPGAIATEAYAYDPVRAQQALAASSYGGPENLPEVIWYGWEGDAGNDPQGQWLYEQFRQVLGVELELVYLPEEEYDALYDSPETTPAFHQSIWFAQPDPRGWFAIWRCGSPFNESGYCNPDLDALLDQADAELDPERRTTLYEEAGNLLVADVPAIFVYSSNSTYLVKPFVTGYTRTTGVNGSWPGWMNLLTVDVAPPG